MTTMTTRSTLLELQRRIDDWRFMVRSELKELETAADRLVPPEQAQHRDSD